MKHFHGICLLLVIKIVQSNTSLALVSPKESKMSEFLKELIYNDIMLNTVTVRVSVETESKLTKWNFGDTIGQFLSTVYQSKNKRIMLELRDADIKKRTTFDLHARILFVDTFKSLRNLIVKERLHDQHLSVENQLYYIILPPEISLRNYHTFLEQIMHLCLRNFIINLNVLVEQANQDIITAYTFYPFTYKSCRSHSPIVHNRFINGSLQFENYQTFPAKLNNFWQCPLFVVFSEEPPFIIVEDNKISGIDGWYLNTLANMMNFSINAILSEETGRTSPNGTINGVFKMMNDGIGDFSLGGSFCDVHRMSRFSSTTDYFTTYLKIVVKFPKPYSSLEILLLPFDCYTWFTLLTLLLAKWIGNVFWKRNSMEMASIDESSARFHILTWLFSILILQSSYEGSIFKFLHNSPRREIPSDLEEALAKGYKIIAKSSYYTALKEFSDFSDQFMFVDASLANLIEEFNISDGKYALVILGELLMNSNKTQELKYSNFITVKNPLIQNILCMYLPKFSYLTNELNRRIKQLKYFGHLKKFYDKPSKMKFSNKKVRNIGKDVNIISLSKLSGAFQLLGVFMSLGVLVFFVELFSVQNRTLRKFVELVH
ncbi:uncharacterized protein LOC129941176 [Eupeodes corollae]|uniref:uncharacterized protein LOC129941176 n=1 Tax=Eupeodes corollae TaxID=290404 RepID=UPI002492C664|nr:uncharacterized protein LOC129941176 [Eupeodes corollae]